MRQRIYVDTSVFGGCEDVEFIGHSRRLVAAMVAGDYSMVISEVTLLELEKAPAAVRAHLERVPESLVEVLALDAEAEALANTFTMGPWEGMSGPTRFTSHWLRRPGSMSSSVGTSNTS